VVVPFVHLIEVVINGKVKDKVTGRNLEELNGNDNRI
jgi:hypothetical protein